jgi:hypothetical protein
VQTNAAGQVVLKLKTPWRDGTTHLVMSPLEFMQRLAALVPRPRLHLIRFHGVLAPNAKLRAQVVPQEPEPPAQAAPPVECEATCAHHRPAQQIRTVVRTGLRAPCRDRKPKSGCSGPDGPEQPLLADCRQPAVPEHMPPIS